MRYLYLLIIPFFFLNTSSSKAQQVEKERIYPSLILKYSPLSLINMTTPSFLVSAESFIGYNYGLEYSLGYIFDNNNQATLAGQEPQRGGLLRLELHYYSKGIYTKRLNRYWGMGVQTQIIKTDNNWNPNTPPYYLFNNRVGLYGTYGWQYHWQPFIIDFGVSSGVTFELYNNYYIDYHTEPIPITSGQTLLDSEILLLLNLNLKIGYSF